MQTITTQDFQVTKAKNRMSLVAGLIEVNVTSGPAAILSINAHIVHVASMVIVF